MRRFRTAAAFLASVLAFSDMAATQVHFTSPAGYLTSEGAARSSWFGSSSYGRYSLQDGTLRNFRFGLKEIAMRRDYTAYQNVGRRWFSVEVRMSECNIAAKQNTWTQMPVTTPTQVFKSAVQWPSTQTPPTSKPLPFDKRFPFRTTWTYSGNADINAEFEFVGGILDNNLAWKTSRGTYYSTSIFHLDASTNSYGASVGLPTKIGSGCLGSPAAWFGASAGISAHTYNSQYTDPRFHGHTLVQMTIGNAHPGPAVFALGVAATTGRTFPGIACEKVYIDASKPVAYFFGSASSFNPKPAFFGRYHPSFRGMSLVGQALFTSWTPGTLGLTSAVRLQVPGMPALEPERFMWWSDDWRNTTATGPILAGVPLVRMTR